MRFKASFITLFLAASLSLSAAQRIGKVHYPLAGRPAMVMPGESFVLEYKVENALTGWRAHLELPFKSFANTPCQVSPLDFADGIQTVQVTVPAGQKYELYDLVVSANGASQERVPRAVKVIPVFKNRFTFVHLPDCHLPAVSWIGFYDDPNTVPEFRQILNEINFINPDFVLQTGDIVDNGQDESQYQIAQDLMDAAEVPLFLTGGNHDLWYRTGRNLWKAYFNPVMDYDFSYGDVRFVGLEMYDIPTKTYRSDQMVWLQNVLNQSITARDTSRIIFTHYDESQQLTSEFVDTYHVDGIFYGHTHINGVQTLGLRQAQKINTSYTMNDNGEYRLVTIDHGEIVSKPVIQFRNLTVDISPDNDGNSRHMKAVIRNQTGVDLDSMLVKFHVENSGTFTWTGGTYLQHIEYDNGNKAAYYFYTSVEDGGEQTVELQSSTAQSGTPFITAHWPVQDTTIFSTDTLPLAILVESGGVSPEYSWRINGGDAVSGANSSNFNYQSDNINFEGEVTIEARAEAADIQASHLWHVEIKKSSGKPQVLSETRNFFPHNDTLELGWHEPISGEGQLIYGLIPGHYPGSVNEWGSSNSVKFVPEEANMGLGLYFCRIEVNGLRSDEFPIVIESPVAPQMVSPIGKVQTLKPVFQWEAVQGVPYYFVILTDHEVVLTEDPETGDYSLEGANPIWAVLTSETSVSYGAPDPSGTFTSFPAPLSRGHDYWWVVLNCYGNAAELTSTVQSGVSHFKVDLPLPDLDPPVLVAPSQNATLNGDRITFRWEAVSGAMGYNFYPFKVEIEENIEVVRPIWETVLTTTNTLLDYPAGELMVDGTYQWKVAAVDEDGSEIPSETRTLVYEAPFGRVNLITYDSKGTPVTTDDRSLPRVNITYNAISGVDMGLPLSTDESGSRTYVKFAPGEYEFTANKEGFEPTVLTQTVTENDTVTLRFRMPPDPSMLTGRVADTTGQSIASATVRAVHSLHPDMIRQTPSSQNGEFSLSLTPGPWIIWAAKSGFENRDTLSLSITSGQILRLDTPLELIRNTNEISGTIVNPSSRPVYGATVTLTGTNDHFSQNTDAEGLYHFTVKDGSWTLGVAKNGFTSPARRTISVSGGQRVTVSPDMMLTPAGAMISGTVSDGLKAVSQAVVKAIPAAGAVVEGISDGFGRYNLSLPAGTYTLHAEKAGFSSVQPATVPLTAGETVTGVELTLVANSGSVSGLVTLDGFTPVPDARVTVNGATVMTGDGGFYSVDIAPGTYSVRAYKTGYISSEDQTITIGPGQDVGGVNFTLTPNASVISGRVLLGTQGVAGAEVHAVNGVTVTEMTDDGGYYSLNVQAGTYTLHAEKEGFLSETETVTIGDAQTMSDQDIGLTRNIATLSGTVRHGEDATLLMNATIQIAGIGLSTTSKADGTYILETEPAASYDLSIMKSGFVTLDTTVSGLAAEEQGIHNFALNPSSTSISGRVVAGVDSTPVADARVMAISTQNDTTQSRSGSDGAYFIALPSVASTYRVLAVKTGYRFTEESQTVVSGQKISGFDLGGQSIFGNVGGQVTEQISGDFIDNVSLSLHNNGDLVGTAVSEAGGYFDFSADGVYILPPDTYTLHISKTGYADTVFTDLVVPEADSLGYLVMIRKYLGFIEGQVTDGSGPLPNASVTAQNQTTGAQLTRVTDAQGQYQFTGIPQGDYRVKASLTGYASPPGILVSAPDTDVDLTLVENTGRFRGVAVHSETGDSLANVSVKCSDGQGNEILVLTDAEGAFDTDRLRKMPTLNNYTLSLRKTGFVPKDSSDVSPALGADLIFAMTPQEGNVSGTIFLSDSLTPRPDITVVLTSDTASYETFSGGEGEYNFSDLPVGVYYAAPSAPGFLSTPASRTLDLSEGGDSLNVTFYLEEARVEELAVAGPAIIQNGRTGQFTAAGKSADGRTMMIDPRWSVSPPTVVDSVTADGRVYLQPDFLGAFWVCVTDNYSTLSDSMQVLVVATIEPGDTARVFQDYRNGVFELPDDCVVQPVQFGLKYPRLSDTKRVMREHKIVGDVYAFQPANLILKEGKPMRLTLPVQGASSSGLAKAGAASAAGDIDEIILARWNMNRLSWEWEDISFELSGDGSQITTNSLELAQWAVLASAEDLGLRQWSAQPNPFSPYLEPLSLSFTPTSRASMHLFITMKLYNMNGDLVRVLIENEQVPKDMTYQVIWDGKNDNGDLALNGRYVLFVEVKDGNKTKTMLKSVVMVK